MNFLAVLTYLIIFFGVVNLLRMAMFLVGSNIYDLKNHIRKGKETKNRYPKFSVIIPAHNEEKTIIRCVSSVFDNDYPNDLCEVIVVDDGSKDMTSSLVEEYKEKYNISYLKIIKQKKSGKANALNNGIKSSNFGELVMCLDADSYLAGDALSKAAKYFEDPKVSALSANVKIIEREGFLNLIQRFEYLVCYQMKRAQTVFNIEYIIGGIGSTFRRSVLEKINYYDTNTVTEDIDLTMKIIRNGNKKNRVIYGADVVAYTESVLSLGGLVKQRYRWKYGRCQTFLKNRNMFFNFDKKFTKGLTYFYLPFAIFGDFAFFFEPIFVGFILYVALTYRDPLTILSAFIVISIYISFNILAEDTIKGKEKIFLLIIAPTMYFYFYVLSFVEYVALVKAIIYTKDLKKSIETDVCDWKHVERLEVAG